MGAQKNYFDGVGMRFIGRVHIIFRTLWITIYFLQNLTSHWIVDTFRSFEKPPACSTAVNTLFFPRNILVSSNKACKFSCSLSLSLSFTCASNYICIYVTEHYDFHRHIDSISAFSTNMSSLRDYKPAMAMLALQFSYAVVALSTRAALLQGMNPRVFVVYRQAIATLFMAPMAYLSRCVVNYFSFIFVSTSNTLFVRLIIFFPFSFIFLLAAENTKAAL